MDTVGLLVAAAALAVVVGIVHSALGEFLIFRRLRWGGLVPSEAAPVFAPRHLAIIWASWHALTVFGFALAAILLRTAEIDPPADLVGFVRSSVALAMGVAGALVLFATRARHPGWIALLLVAVMIEWA
jgi:hypothetical protein